jgi:hypothetical protein
MKTKPGVRQAGIGLMMTCITQAMRTNMTMVNERRRPRHGLQRRTVKDRNSA